MTDVPVTLDEDAPASGDVGTAGAGGPVREGGPVSESGAAPAGRAVSGGAAPAGEGVPDGGAPGLTLTTTHEVAVAIESGELEPAVAFMQGRLKADGDMRVLYALLASGW